MEQDLGRRHRSTSSGGAYESFSFRTLETPPLSANQRLAAEGRASFAPARQAAREPEEARLAPGATAIEPANVNSFELDLHRLASADTPTER